jgi:CheY-like chemotaxis protein/HPt (histidine-containing phosphotransfer) domain-containing protein
MRPVCLESARAAMTALCQAADSADPFRIVLTDVHMPDVDGFELASQIRLDGRLHSTVIMMLTSGAGPGDIARCRELGASTHLIKPIKSSELFDSIALAIGSGPQAAAHVADTKTDRPLKILLAEDNAANQHLAMGVLRKWGHELTIVNNGIEAVAAFAPGRFDVILMDVQMPEMDGHQATAQIRALERVQGGHVPIVAMTANAMKGDRDECLQSGMDDYVTKPIRWADLREVLQRLPGNSATFNSGATIHGSDDGVVDASEWTLNWEAANRAVDSDPVLLRDILCEMVTDWPKLLADLDRAASVGDAVGLRRAAHTLAGNLRVFGEADVVHVAEKIQSLAAVGQVQSATEMLAAFRSQVEAIIGEVKRRLDWQSGQQRTKPPAT